jgi:hypothetical protein
VVVDQQAGGSALLVALQEFRAGREATHGKSMSLQQSARGIADCVIVIDDGYKPVFHRIP